MDNEPVKAKQPVPLSDVTPIRVTVVQRSTALVPRMGDRIRIHIDDITGGQVKVKLIAADGSEILPGTSISGKQRLPFEFEGGDYTIHLVELINLVAGDDYGVFQIEQAKKKEKQESSPVEKVVQPKVVEPAEATEKPRAALDETQKIEHLISAIESMEGATFIRNGKAYTTAEAAKHMRDKWRWKRREIKTAADFIRVAASKSTMSGKPYTIRMPDGSEITSGAYLQQKLERLNSES